MAPCYTPRQVQAPHQVQHSVNHTRGDLGLDGNAHSKVSNLYGTPNPQEKLDSQRIHSNASGSGANTIAPKSNPPSSGFSGPITGRINSHPDRGLHRTRYMEYAVRDEGRMSMPQTHAAYYATTSVPSQVPYPQPSFPDTGHTPVPHMRYPVGDHSVGSAQLYPQNPSPSSPAVTFREFVEKAQMTRILIFKKVWSMQEGLSVAMERLEREGTRSMQCAPTLPGQFCTYCADLMCANQPYELMYHFIAQHCPPTLLIASPTPPLNPLRVLHIPADGAAPRIISLFTIDVRSDFKEDRILGHIPDMRSFWGSEGWASRRVVRSVFSETYEHVLDLNATYYILKSSAENTLPPNEHFESGVWGDVCIVRSAVDPIDTHVFKKYADISMNILGMDHWKFMFKGVLKIRAQV